MKHIEETVNDLVDTIARQIAHNWVKTDLMLNSLPVYFPKEPQPQVPCYLTYSTKGTLMYRTKEEQTKVGILINKDDFKKLKLGDAMNSLMTHPATELAKDWLNRFINKHGAVYMASIHQAFKSQYSSKDCRAPQLIGRTLESLESLIAGKHLDDISMLGLVWVLRETYGDV